MTIATLCIRYFICNGIKISDESSFASNGAHAVTLSCGREQALVLPAPPIPVPVAHCEAPSQLEAPADRQ
ncbi:hypothetical protein L1887_57346 [Cichorium endivia]|nr:hypothetical protein L1887_57346 [Cichorium endivia]